MRRSSSKTWADCGRLLIVYGLTAVGVGALLVWEALDRLARRASPKSEAVAGEVLHECAPDDLRHVTG